MGRVINIDDGGSFEKLMEEVKKGAEDESKVMELLQLKIFTAFVNRIRQEAARDNYFKNQEKTTTTKNNNYNHLLDHTFVPKKKRSLQHSRGSTSSQEVEDDLKIKKRVSRRKRFFDSESSEEEEEKEIRIKKKVKMMKKPKKLERVNFENLGLVGLPEMPNEWKTRITEIGGGDIKLVIMKQIFKTDLSKHHDRLSIPCKQIIQNDFLSEEDRLNLQQNYLTVKLMEPCNYFVSEMVLRKWDLHKTSNYALTTSWNKVLDRNLHREFKQNDIIQLWSFRVNEELWFALIKVWDAPGPGDNDIAIGTSGSGSGTGNGDGASTSHTSTVVDQEQC